MPSAMPPWQAGPDHLRLSVRLTPKSSADRVEGRAVLSDGREVLAARVRAVPEDGAANTALIRLMAASLSVPRSAVTIARGETARLKQLRIAGDPAALLDRAERLWPSSAKE